MVRKLSKDQAADEQPELNSMDSFGDLVEDDQNDQRLDFPIVGIGASAGGLEALEQFLGNVPEGLGMSFVIVQHLDPTHKGIMPELLQRSTTMPVVQVHERQLVEPNCVYVIPPNKDMTILHRILHLMDPVAPRGLRLPIDSFFRSLAEDAQNASVGVILSGMGSDGTLGLRAIKEQAGLSLAQELTDAKFDGMPRSAINAGLVDIVAPAKELARKIAAALESVPQIIQPELAVNDTANSGLEKVIALLRAQTGHDFFEYKKSTLYRRIERRMGIHQIDKIANYVRFLQGNSGELELLFRELLIGVTSFFRDPEEWERLKNEAIPALLTEEPHKKEIRAWVVGCSTGEEAYSLAMVFKEALEQINPRRIISIQIFATDLDKDAIDRARQGLYPPNIAADMSAERLTRFFVEENGSYRVGKEIREMVIFAPQNVIKDPPFTKLDILTCRNVLIYMESTLQQVVLRLFHYSLNPGGILFLGSAESVVGLSQCFDALNAKPRLYRRLESDHPMEPVVFPRIFVPGAIVKPMRQEQVDTSKTQRMADQLLLQNYSPAAVLVNNRGDVVYISGRTGKYLEPAAGKANWNIFVMAREGLRYELISSFQKALRQKEKVVLKNLTVGTNGGTQTIDLTIQSIYEPTELYGLVLIVFTEVLPIPKIRETKRTSTASVDAARAEAELKQSNEELQSLREEMQSSQEELRSTNEELQSSNEELQSTNEELTTSREEMQSMNEELQTVNSELVNKIDELSSTSDDMKNLLNSTDIATVFLDSSLRLRRFTHEATQMFRLIAGDVGRPITDIASDLLYPDMVDDVKEVLRTLVFTEKHVSTREGKWYTLRIMPYRTVAEKIDGVVITILNITEFKRVAEALQKANDLSRLAVVVRDSHDAITVQDLEGCIIAWSPAAEKMYGWSEAEALLLNIRDRVPERLRAESLEQMHKLIRSEVLAPYKTQRVTKYGNTMEVWVTASALINEGGQMYAIATTERGKVQGRE